MFNFIRFGSVIVIASLLLAGCGTLSKDAQQKELKSFQTQIDKDTQPVSNAETNLQIALATFNGSDTNTLDTSVAALKDRSDSAESDFSTMSAPSGFPDDVDTLLSDAINNLMLAYHNEYDGANRLSKYISSQNPNDLQNYKDKMAEAKNNKAQANDDLTQAKQKIGLQ